MDASLDQLKKSSYFNDLSSYQLQKVAGISSLLKFKRGELVLKEADRGDTIYLVVSGRVDISVSLVGQNRREIIATLGEGEIVGEMILLGKNRRSADVTAKDDIEVLSWRAGDLNKLFETDTSIGFLIMRNIAKQMSERLLATNQALRNTISSSLPIF